MNMIETICIKFRIYNEIQCPKYKQFIDLGPRPRIGKYNFDEVYTFLIFQIEILIKIGGEISLLC